MAFKRNYAVYLACVKKAGKKFNLVCKKLGSLPDSTYCFVSRCVTVYAEIIHRCFTVLYFF